MDIIFLPLGAKNFSDQLPPLPCLALVPPPSPVRLLPSLPRTHSSAASSPFSLSLSLSLGLKNTTRLPDAHCSACLISSPLPLALLCVPARSLPGSEPAAPEELPLLLLLPVALGNGEEQPRLLRSRLAAAPAAAVAGLRHRAEELHLEDAQWYA